jgi:hypothetical protein
MRAAAVAAFLLVAAAATAQEADYLVRGGQLPIQVAANGYVQTVALADDGAVEVHIATVLGPTGSRGGYGELVGSEQVLLPDGFALPRRVRESLSRDISAWEAATRVLEWSATHIEVDADDVEAQDAISVLARGRGRCSGVANATAALLMAAGFEAMTVSGLLVTDGGVIPHRWVACRLPGAGWVHTDPTLGLWTMTPSHMAFPATVTEPPEVRVLRRGEDRISSLPRRGGRPLRPNEGSELLCRLVGGAGEVAAVAVLTGSGGEIHRAVLDPEGRFTALLPGRWRLVVTAGDEVVEDRELVLKAGELQSYAVEMPPARSRDEVGS